MVPQQQCQTLPQQDCVSVPNQSCLNPSLACSSQPREGAIFGKISRVAANSHFSMATRFSPNIDQTVTRQECRNVCNNVFWCKVGPTPAIIVREVKYLSDIPGLHKLTKLLLSVYWRILLVCSLSSDSPGGSYHCNRNK